jgi:hypothetical protein
MRRSLLRRIAGALVGVLLFAQLAVSAYACPTLLPARAQGAPMAATAPKDAGAGDSQGATNCADMDGATDATSSDPTNLCVEHCRQGQQSDQTSTVTVPVAVMTALYAISPLRDTAARLPSTAASPSALIAASPPPTVRHCRFLI